MQRSAACPHARARASTSRARPTTATRPGSCGICRALARLEEAGHALPEFVKAELLFKAPWRSGVAHADVTPDKFLARLCALVPPPGPSTALALRRDHHDPKLLHTLPSDGDPQEFTISSGGSEFLTITGITSATPNIKTATATDPQAFLKLILTAT